MNRFLTHTGRQPIWLDDLNFIQDSFADEVKKLVQGIVGLKNDPVILSGCEVSMNEDGTYKVSEGIIYLNGDILRLQEGSYPQIDTLRIREDISYDSNGDRTLLETSDVVSCYECKAAELTVPRIAQGKPDTSPSFSSCIRLDDILDSKNKKVVLVHQTATKRTVIDDQTIETDLDLLIYRKNDLYYCDISFDSVGFCQCSLTGKIPSISVLSREWEALGASKQSDSNQQIWKQCYTIGSLNAISGISLNTPLCCSVLLRTYVDLDSDQIAYECKIVPSSNVASSKPVYGSAHIKLNTL